MPISSTSCGDPYCEGFVLEVTDEDLLAQTLARILVQQHQAALRVLSGGQFGPTPPGITAQVVETVIKNKLGIVDNAGNEIRQRRYHRDGLLFQLITWLASYRDTTTQDDIQRPHFIAASKGCDGLIVHLDSNRQVLGASICEDKATSDPRGTVHSEVWPEIEKCEMGAKDEDLRVFVADVLVRRGLDPDNAEFAAGAILWAGMRRYRVRTTVGAAHRDPPDRGHLFSGFENLVVDNSKRRGETLFVDDLRNWMDGLVDRIKLHLRAMAV